MMLQLGRQMNTFKMLVAEHDQEVSQFLSERLNGAGYEVRTAATGRTALTLLETIIFDAALIAVDLPDMLGIELSEVATRRDPEMDIVLLTGLSELETAVQALRLGAFAYLIKPLDWTSLHHCVKQMIDRRYLRQELAYLRSRLASDPQVGDLIGSSPRVLHMKDSIAKAGPADSAVLLEGEGGTGKELVATAIHRSSSRRDGPFIAVNCAAVPADLMENELFGHHKGAFSRADGGTLFLDHVDELPAALQPRLMRILQEKELNPAGNTQAQTVDVRIVSATNKNLAEAVQAGRFRQ